MFTGLIEDVGTIRELRQAGEQLQVTVATALPMQELTLGESIAVNGICLTVVEFGQGIFKADVSPETWQRTSLRDKGAGARVNLERALRLSDRLGGHLVSGHVDTVGRVLSLGRERNATRLELSIETRYARHVVEKGSICLDGISLTVNSVADDRFSVMIIPHTLAATSLRDCRIGTLVNIETDLLAKYIERLLGGGAGPAAQGSLGLDFLAKHGFM